MVYEAFRKANSSIRETELVMPKICGKVWVRGERKGMLTPKADSRTFVKGKISPTNIS